MKIWNENEDEDGEGNEQESMDLRNSKNCIYLPSNSMTIEISDFVSGVGHIPQVGWENYC